MSELSWGSGPTRFFFDLTPDRVMDAVEKDPVLGKREHCTGFCQPLASFENRVYEIEFESGIRKIAKFYRPGRWNETQIREEHRFMLEIQEAEVPVVVPDWFEREGDTLRQTAEGLFYCIYPKTGGRQPEDLSPGRLEQLGRLIARMHAVGMRRQAPARVRLNPETYGRASISFLSASGRIPRHLENRILTVMNPILDLADERFRNHPLQRIHGDCHAGNLLWNGRDGFFFIDFDDMVTGPPVQDLWLLAPDEGALQHLVEGYLQMKDLPPGSLALVEILRALRMVHYTTWIAKRYEDPAFQKAFPQFESPRYWEEWTADLERQSERIK